jgi:FlaA1/EpsC-like NDP-sugar epimerase
MNNIFKNSKILITGGTGSWGNELVKQLLANYDVAEIKIYSRGEHKQVEMKRKFQSDKISYFIGDVRDKNRLLTVSRGVDYIFHLAALKHVPVCEENPYEAVQTNIIGTQNVVECAIENNIKKVIDISTDKAVDPFNLYGVTKSCGEKLIIAGNLYNKTKFVCIRAGNVMGTNGSVIPLFKEQIKKINHVTITSEEMSRFLMRVEDAINLVLYAAINSIGGEVFVMKMPSCKIIDLANVMIEKFGNDKTQIKNIGIRPGEKLHEVLVSRYEMPSTYDLDKYFVILPQLDLKDTAQLKEKYAKIKSSLTEFNSDNTYILSQKEIFELLEKDGWFEDEVKKESLSILEDLNKDTLDNFFKSEGWSNKI